MTDTAARPSIQDAIFSGGGAMGALMRGLDWGSTPLGQAQGWPQPLKTLIGVMLAAEQPMFLAWGPAQTLVYNDSYAAMLADRHPAALGRAFLDVWSEARDDLTPLVDQVFAGEPVHMSDITLQLDRPGRPREAHFAFSYTPVRDDAGQVVGLFCPCTETTEQVLADRARQQADAALRQSEARLRGVLDGIGECFVLLDHDFRVLEINPAGMKLETRTRDEIIGRSHWDIWPGVEHTKVGEAYRRAMATREPFAFEHHYVWPDGRAAWFDLRVYPSGEGLALFYRDISDRKRAEAAVAESEARFRSMADGAPVIMWVTDPDGCCTHLNRRWYEFTGQAEGEGRGYGWLDAVHPDDRAAAERAFTAANAEQRDYRVDFRLRRADGVYRWTIDAAAARIDADGRFLGYVGSVIDIDDRREMEDALRASESRLRMLNADLERQVAERVQMRGRTWQVSPELMCVINADGYFEAANPAWERVLGWGEAELAKSIFPAFVHPDDVAGTQAVWADTIEHGLPALRFENRYRTKEGGWRWLSWVAVPEDGKIYCSARDVTEEKAAAAERDRLWEYSQDMLARADYSGVMTAVNPAWTTVLGWPRQYLLTTPYAEFMHPDDAGVTLSAIEDMSRTNLPIRFQNRIATADGGWTPIDWTVVPEPGGDAFIAVGRDLTEDRAREAELANTQEALRQSQKLESMGQLTGGVAHDFNNLLTPIIGSLDMLMRRGLGNERERRLIDGALQSAERAKTLVQRLLAFARRQPLQPTAVDVRALVQGMAGLIGSTLGPKVDIRVDITDDLPPALADPNQLEMAILNLAVNARDAMPEGGELTIAASRDSVRPRDGQGLPIGHYIRLSVGDTGVGMDEATRERAIEPFFSTKGIGKGTGLGLSMAHGLAAQLGGGLTIRSVEGEGTTIDLWLPISAGAVAEGNGGSVGYRNATARGTALLVDDEDLVRMSTADMLNDLGYEVVEADSGEDALRLVEAGTRPDILVTDHLMPGISGETLARALRAITPDLPVLIVSGYAEAEGIAVDLPRLTKPFRNAELAERLASVHPAPKEAAVPVSPSTSPA